MIPSFKASFYALLFIAAMLISNLFLAPIFLSLPINPFLLSIISEVIVYGVPVVIFIIASKGSAFAEMSVRPLGFANIAVTAAMSFFMQPILMLISAVSAFIFPNTTTAALETYSQQPFWIMALSVAVIPAIFEELIFRGIVFGNYRNVPLKKAAAATGLLFGLAHMNGQQFLYAFFMGIIFCLMVYKTGSVFSSIVSHFTINFSQSAAAYIIFKTAPAPSADASSGIFSVLYLTVLTLPILAVLVYVFMRINKKAPSVETERAVDYTVSGLNENVINFPFVLYACLCVFFILMPLFSK